MTEPEKLYHRTEKALFHAREARAWCRDAGHDLTALDAAITDLRQALARADAELAQEPETHGTQIRTAAGADLPRKENA